MDTRHQLAILFEYVCPSQAIQKSILFLIVDVSLHGGTLPCERYHFPVTVLTLATTRSIMLTSVGLFRISLKTGFSCVSVITSSLLKSQSWFVISCSAINYFCKDTGEQFQSYAPQQNWSLNSFLLGCPCSYEDADM